MADESVDRGGSYRRRLARAAAASCALHMLLFSGLSVSRLDIDVAEPESLEAREPKKPKRPAADFRLQVPRSAAAQKPAHERPLEMPVTPPATTPAEPRERPTERNVAAREPRPAEEQPAVTPSAARIEPTRARDTAAAPADRQSPSRQAEANPEESTAKAEQVAPAQAVTDAAAAAPAPATLAARDRPEAARVAARWRPREVALLERLTARAPDAAALAARDAPAAAAAASASRAMDRRSTADATSSSDARAQSIAAPTAVQAAATPAVAPAARDVARRQSSRAAAAGSGATADTARDAPRIDTSAPAAATVARSATPSGTAGGAPAASAGRSALARRQTAVAGGTAATQVAMPATGTVATESGATGTAAAQLAPAATAVASSGGGGRTAPRGSALASGRQTGAATEGDSAAAAAVGGSPVDGSAIAAVGSLRGGGRAGDDDAGSDGSAGQARRPLGRDSGGGSAAALDVGTVAAVAPAAGAATTVGGTGDKGERLGPALLDRGRRGTAGRSAIAAARGLPGGGSNADAGDGEGLSMSPADIAALGAGGRERAGLPERAAGTRAPERIAAAALPSDGRVRDVAEAFAGRTPAGGRAAGGIDDAATLDRARQMVDRGLEFLARSQLADGRWRLTEFAGVTEADVPKLESDTAATGLALLAFFGAGHDHFHGTYRDHVRRGLEFLISVQKPDGDLFLPADDLSNSCSWLYSHGIASIALCEAVGMTGDPRVRPAAEKACGFIAATRHPTLGGWRYTPRTDADLSVSGWMLVALRAGDLGGVKTDPAALDGVRTLLAASASPSDPTRYAYNARKADQRRTDLSVACMTAVGTLMRLHTNAAADDPGVVAAGKTLADFRPAYGTAAKNLRDAYLWYYASQALVHTGGEGWQTWYASLVDTLEPEQRITGPLAGSWDATGAIPDRWGPYGGRVYVTALHLLALEVPWRHLPTYATAPGR
jgi:hypothetical protein